MPIYEYYCDKCVKHIEVLQRMDTEPPLCCGKAMTKKPTHPAMVRIRGEGLYPSEQKHVRGTAPFTAQYKTKAWGDYDPDKENMEGRRLKAAPSRP